MDPYEISGIIAHKIHRYFVIFVRFLTNLGSCLTIFGPKKGQIFIQNPLLAENSLEIYLLASKRDWQSRPETVAGS